MHCPRLVMIGTRAFCVFFTDWIQSVNFGV